MNLDKFFKKGELIPVICQDERNNEILMLGYANKQALQNTMDTGTAWFFSRSRQKLWNKGETSGNYIFVSEILTDCDDDTLIYRSIPKGPTCHTGNRTCFFQPPVWKKAEE
ncbi:MAG: phosphoribosyl-AMP cyclohydrolase [Eubacteriales bacterium]|nr:phosphoribosyl-AMP cyclohydrolase [Eubacteriales bacterium]